MEINITLFIQIANFLLTYYLLNKLIFAPVIASLNKKKKEENAFLKSLNNEEAVLLEKQKEENAQLCSFQQKLATKYKKPKKEHLHIKFDIAYKRDPVEVKNTIKKVKDLLVEEVPRVR